MNEGCGPISLEAVRRGAPWLLGRGAESDVVVSSRLRLARNVAGTPFPHRATSEQRAATLLRCRDAIVKANPVASGARLAWIDLHTLPPVARSLLVERHIVSKELARGGAAAEPVVAGGPQQAAPAPGGTLMHARGVALSLPDEALSVMVNEEDHLRLQVVLPGLALGEALRRATEADQRIATMGGLEYAASARFGYLTACPTNVGTGVRMSVMLHLPALRLTGEIEKARRAVKDLNLAVRGFYGEGSESIGDLYQISNQTTLGRTEEQILGALEREILPRVLDYERAARHILVQRKRRLLEDQVYRALGILRNARLLTPEETLGLLSMVRLGVLTRLIPDLSDQVLNPLFVLAQPAHVQWLAGRELDQQQRREARADFVRERLAGA